MKTVKKTTPLKKAQFGGRPIGSRMKSKKAAGGRCKTTKSYQNSKNNTCKGGSNNPLEKFKKAVKVITTVTGLGAATIGGLKVFNKLKK